MNSSLAPKGKLVHRDVKPSNVIFVHGVAKLADIGLVATAGDSRSIVGTEGYWVQRPRVESAGGRSQPGRHLVGERLPSPEAERWTALWEAEWKQDLFARALEHLKTLVPGKSFQIFDLYGLHGWSAREVARSLDVSLTRVYVTKHRLAALLKKEIQRLQRQQE